MLLEVLKGLVHRAHVLCDRKEDLLEELALLKQVSGEAGTENSPGVLGKGDT